MSTTKLQISFDSNVELEELLNGNFAPSTENQKNQAMELDDDSLLFPEKKQMP